VALYLRYEAHVCGLVSVMLAGKGGLSSEQRCAEGVLFVGGKGYACWVVRQRKAQGNFLGEVSMGARGHRRVMRWEIHKGQRGMPSLVHHWEMAFKCKLSVHPGCSGGRRNEGGCLRA